MPFSEALLNHVDHQRPAVRRGLGRGLVYAFTGSAFAFVSLWIGFGDGWLVGGLFAGLALGTLTASVARCWSVLRGYRRWKLRRALAENGTAVVACVCPDSLPDTRPDRRPRLVNIVFTFDPDVSADPVFLAYLAARASTEFRGFRGGKFQPLPLGWTDGAAVYRARIAISDIHLRRSGTDTFAVVCVAQQGRTRELLPIPAWIAVPYEKESESATGNRR